MEADLRQKMKIKTILFSIFLLLITDSAYAANLPTVGYYGSMLGIILVGAVCFLYRILPFLNKKTNPLSFAVVLILCEWLFISSYFHGAGIGPSAKYIFILITAYCVALTVDFNELMYSIVHVLFVLAAVASVMWIIVFLFPGVYDSLPPMAVVRDGQNAIYRTIGFANMFCPDYELMPRLYSVFWEPGVAQAYFNIAMILSFKLIEGRRKILYISVFLIAVILTLSTTGYIVSAAILLYILLSGKDEEASESKAISALKIGILIGMVVLLLILPEITSTDVYITVFDKLNDGTENQSVESRLGSITGSFEVLKDNFLLGVGLNQSVAAVWDTGLRINLTNTVMDYFVSFGIIIGGLFIACWASFIRSLSESVLELLTIVITFVLIFSGENFIQSLFFNVLMMYGLTSLIDRSDFVLEKDNEETDEEIES